MRAIHRTAAVLIAAALFASPLRVAAEAGSFPYRLSPLVDGGLAGSALGLYGSSFYFQSVKGSPDQAALDASAIPGFDRWYTSSHSAWMGTTADALMVGAALVPAALIQGRSGNELITLGAMYAETLGLAYALDESLKSIVTRYRPYAYAASSADFLVSDIAASFPSRHATLAFASAVFAGTVFDQLEPASPWRPAVWISGLALAAATSVFRVASGDHFPSDVLAGAAFGSLLGYLVPLAHRAMMTGPGGALALRALPGGAVLMLRLDN